MEECHGKRPTHGGEVGWTSHILEAELCSYSHTLIARTAAGSLSSLGGKDESSEVFGQYCGSS